MELFIKKQGCKCDPKVRQIQEASMIFCHLSLITYVLSLFKAFPIAKISFHEIDFISKKIYADKEMILIIPLVVFCLLCFIYNAAVFNCDIKKMKKLSIVNIAFSIVYFIAYTVYTTINGYDLMFPGYIILISPVISSVFQIYETTIQKRILKTESNKEN